MIGQKQVLEILEKIKEINPTSFLKKLDETCVGMNFILFYLSSHESEVYASTIAEKMHISRARVAVLVQKLINKKFIKKMPSTEDRRIEVLKITPLGISETDTIREQMMSKMSKVIEQVGIGNIYKYIEIGSKIKEILNTIE